MLKSDLIKRLINIVSEKSPEMTEKAVAECVNVIIDQIATTLVKKGRIEIRGFGALALRLQAKRQVRNPKTGKTKIMRERYRITFKPAKKLRMRVNYSH